jgi:hypothetical protein
MYSSGLLSHRGWQDRDLPLSEGRKHRKRRVRLGLVPVGDRGNVVGELLVADYCILPDLAVYRKRIAPRAAIIPASGRRESASADLIPNRGSHAMIPRRRFHRVVFVAAGLYNISWGVWSCLDPQWLFRFAGLPLVNQPAVYACLGMVIGLYGILYLDVARVPERGWMIAAVALAGKILGPIGLLVLIAKGVWPISAFAVCITNDVIWWVPFGVYLKDAWPLFRREFVRDSGGPGSEVDG